MSDDSLQPLFEGRLILGRYRLLRLLSEGNFGGVFHGQLEVFDEPVRHVAVKISKQTGLDKEQAPKVFADSTMLTWVYDRIDDPVARNYLVPVYDLGLLADFDLRGYIVMGIVRGQGSTAGEIRPPRTLEDEIHDFRSGMGPDQALSFFRQVCTVMAAIHELGVIHRDLKPDNILLTDRGQIRVVDFGLAARLDEHGLVRGSDGTHQYMAPETARLGISDARADVYTLGIVLYQMLTGKDPFQSLVGKLEDSPDDRRAWVLDQKSKVRLAPPSHDNPQVQPWLDAIALRCLHADREQRPRNAGALLKLVADGPAQAGHPLAGKASAGMARLLQTPWREFLAETPDWAALAPLVEQEAGQVAGEQGARWFDVMTKLALCRIHLGTGGRVLSVLERLETAVKSGRAAASFGERQAFYEAIAAALESQKTMRHWALDYREKAAAARERAHQNGPPV